MRALGRKKDDTSKLRVCDDHELVDRELEVKIPTTNGEDFRIHKFTAKVLSTDGMSMAANNPSRGMAQDRSGIAAFQEINDTAENGGNLTKEAIEEAEKARALVSSFQRTLSDIEGSLPPEQLQNLTRLLEQTKELQSGCEKGVDRVRELEKNDAQNTKLITLMGHEQGTPGKKKENRPVNPGLAEVAGIIKTPSCLPKMIL